jgi:DNA-binding NarL/FixJ family response regulator
MQKNDRLPPAGLRVFITEDEFYVLILLEDMAAELGCRVVATASTIKSALEKAESCEMDAAILDVNVGGQTIYPEQSF